MKKENSYSITLIVSTLFLANARKSVDKTFKKSFIKKASREKGFAEMRALQCEALYKCMPTKNIKL